MSDLLPGEADILLRLQSSFPLDPRPFRAVGEALGLDEDEVLRAAARLKEAGVLRDISGIFNAHRLGYRIALAAFKTDPAGLERAAKLVADHPGVSHNYERRNDYNLWFTLAVEQDTALEEEAAFLASRCGVRDFLVFRNDRTLKIGVILPVGTTDFPGCLPAQVGTGPVFPKGEFPAEPLSKAEREAVRVLQKDLPLERRAFRELLRRHGSFLGEEELLSAARRLREVGVLRRYAAILRHRKAGFGANVMSAWKFSGEDLTPLRSFVEEPLVTHLYLRSPLKGFWNHPLFAMIHGRTEGDTASLVEKLSRLSGIEDYLLLPTLREFKKKKIEYLGERFSRVKGSPA